MDDRSQKLKNLEHTAQHVGSSTGWRVSFQRDSVGRRLFQAAWLVSASSKQLVLSQSLRCRFVCLRVFFAVLIPSVSEKWSPLIVYSCRDRPRESNQFQGLPWAILSCTASCLSSFLQDGMLDFWSKLLQTTVTSVLVIFFILAAARNQCVIELVRYKEKVYELPKEN